MKPALVVQRVRLVQLAPPALKGLQVQPVFKESRDRLAQQGRLALLALLVPVAPPAREAQQVRQGSARLARQVFKVYRAPQGQSALPAQQAPPVHKGLLVQQALRAPPVSVAQAQLVLRAH